MTLRTNSSPIDAVDAVELTRASDSLTRIADDVDPEDADVTALSSLALPPLATTVADADIDADPV